MTEQHLLWINYGILETVLSEWIYAEDLGRLDCAVCSQVHRDQLLFLMKKCSILTKFLVTDMHMKWITSRKLSLKNIYVSKLNPWVYNKKSLKSVLSKSKHLHYLSCSNCIEAKRIVEQHKLRVNTLVISTLERDEAVLSLLVALDKSVQHLDLSQCQFTTDAIYEKINSCCPDLVTFVVQKPVLNLLPLSILKKCKIWAWTNSIDIALKNAWFMLQSSPDEANDAMLSLDGLNYQLVGISTPPLLKSDGIESIVPHLKYLLTASLKKGTPQRLVQLIADNCFNLTRFSATSTKVTRSNLKCIFHHSRNLNTLQLLNCASISTVEIAEAITLCPLLSSIWISVNKMKFISTLNIESIKIARQKYHLIEPGGRLRTLITPANIFHYPYFVNVVKLNFDYGEETNITNATLVTLLASCPLLQDLRTGYRSHLTEDCVSTLVQFEHLTSLTVYNWTGLTETMVDKLMQDLPKLYLTISEGSKSWSESELVKKHAPRVNIKQV